MLRSAGVAAFLILQVSPALAQRANENAVTSANDAFGNSVGSERIGLYNVSDVRGFNPIQAGNIRIEGLSVTEHGGFTGRIITGSTIRVGLTAQSYPFPAPTGIADYSLRTAGDDLVVSPVVYFGPVRSTAIDVDAQIPIIKGKLSLATGFTARFDEAFIGDTAKIGAIGGVLRWRPS
ncbi:MAG TPA: TonB-dependent receptor, partial [Allosphingosinicella sp.]